MGKSLESMERTRAAWRKGHVGPSRLSARGRLGSRAGRGVRNDRPVVGGCHSRFGSRTGRCSGQTFVEFAFVAPLLLFMIFGIIAIGWMAWQRAAIDAQLSSVAYQLPSNWSSYTDQNALVKDMLLDGASIDGNKLSVSNASVSVSQDRTAVSGSMPDALSMSAGADTTATVHVSADVTYDVSAPYMPFDWNYYKVHITHSFPTARRFELSGEVVKAG